MKIKAALIDFDGVIVDTDKSTIDFYNKLLLEKGLEPLDYSVLEKKIGKKSIDFLKEVLGDKLSEDELWEMIYRKRETFVREFDKYVEPIEDGIEMVKKFKKIGVKNVITSGNSREMIEKALKVLRIEDYFDEVLAWEDVVKKKPDPEIYFKACEKLGAKQKECIIVEDSPTGLEGALKTNMAVATKKLKYNKKYWDKVDILAENYSDIPDLVELYFF